MANAIILHGRNCSPDMFWYSYLGEGLRKRGYDVWIPALPNTNEAKLEEWLPFVLNNGTINNETVLVGHSAGAAIILSILENIDCRIKQAVLVSGLSEADTPRPYLQEAYDWDKIRSNVTDIIFINSDNDPYGCDDVQGRIMFDKLGGTLIVRHGEGHMGSIRYKQSYGKFPFLLNLIE